MRVRFPPALFPLNKPAQKPLHRVPDDETTGQGTRFLGIFGRVPRLPKTALSQGMVISPGFQTPFRGLWGVRGCCDPMAIRTAVLVLNLPVLNFHALLVTLNREKLSSLLRQLYLCIN